LSDISTVSSAEYIRKNPVDAILGNNENSFINRWNGEIVRDNFTIKMLNHRGSDNGVLVEYKKNLTGFEADELMDGVITKIMPIGKDGLKLPEKYIDSPLISKYPTIKVQSIDFTNCDTIESLRAAAITYFTTTKCDIPRTNYKVNMMELSSTEEYKKYAILERVELGDTVRIRNLNLDVDITARAIVVVKIAVLIEGLLTWITNEIELGDFKDNLGVSTMNALYQLSKVIETNKSDLQKAIENATQLITGTLGGNLVIHQNANGKPYELLIMDTDDIMTAKEVWRWDLGGLGHSSNGYNGPYDTAITQDGAIVADFITTGILNGDLIKAGSITSKNGKLSINLDDDTMTISGTSKWTTPTGYIAIDGDDLVQVYNNNIKNPFFRLLYIGTYSIQGTSTGGVEHRILDIPSQFLGKKWKIFGLPS
jgi:phage-related protein